MSDTPGTGTEPALVGAEPATAAPRKAAPRLALGVLLFFALAFALYWPVIPGQFMWDDALLLDKNPLVKGELNLRSVWFQTDFPLTTVVCWLQWQVWGRHPAGYHIVNILLHAVSAVLLWRLLARLKIPGAWLAALLFLAHPVCVASVAWIAEIKNTLSLPFFLLSLCCYLRFEDLQPGRSRSAFYALSLVAFLLALLSKTSTVMLPAVLLGCAWWRRRRLTVQDLLHTSPHFLLALSFGLLSVWFQRFQLMGGQAIQSENFWGRLCAAGKAVWFYLGKAFLPLHLAMIYPRWSIAPAALLSWVPVIGLCVVVFLCWRFRKSWGRHALFGLGCFAVTLFPALGFFDMYFLTFSRVSDHLQYLPLIAPLALAGAGLAWLLPRPAFKWAGAALVLALACLTVSRAHVFATNENLWQDSRAKNPASACIEHNLGCVFAEKQDYARAVPHFEAALRMEPTRADTYANLAQALSGQGKFGEAEARLREALKLKPGYAKAHQLLGNALAGQGRTQEALQSLRLALRLQPETETRLRLAALLCQTGAPREAVTHYRLALSADPNNLEALNNLAWLLATSADASLRDGAEAVRLAEQACRLTQYKQRIMAGTLAAAYAEAGRFPDAIAAAETALALAQAAGDARFAELNRQLLQFYRAGKPWHQPPPGPVRP